MDKGEWACLTLFVSAILMIIYPLFDISQYMATKIDATILSMYVFYCAVTNGGE